MKINKSLITYLLSRYTGRSMGQAGSDQPSLVARLRPRAYDIIFLALAGGLLLVFMLVGIAELVTVTQFGKWIGDAWQALLGTSPQSLLNQQPNLPQLPNTTVGDVVGAIGQIVLAPLDIALAGLILVFAIFVRLRSYIGRVVSTQRAKSFRAVSWVVLATSLVPPAVDFMW